MRRSLLIRLLVIGMGVAWALPDAVNETTAKPRPRVLVGLEPTAASDCPSGWVCLWEDADFGGPIVMFRDCCNWENLADYGFNNRMSSWRNRKSVDAKVAEFTNGDGERLCLPSGQMDSWVGSSWNDTASSVKVFPSDGACQG